MKKICCIITALALAAPAVAFAQERNPEECSQAFRTDLTAVHDTYRSVLFGSRQIPDGRFEVLTGGFTDEERVGIFETKRRFTSELIPPIIESYRVYRCRSLAVCNLVSESFTANGGPVDLESLGCAQVTGARYPQCYFGPTGDTPGAADQMTSLMNQCRSIMEQTLRAEQTILRLAVGYDAGYRSLLQMAGMMDWMLEGFPTAALKAVSEMVNMLGKLHQIPCFIGQCDNPRSDYLKP